MRVRVQLLAASAALLALLTACGSSGEANADGNASAGSKSTSTAVPDNADPAVRQAYRDVVAKEMPGLPFSVLAGAAKEGEVFWYHRNSPAATQALIKAFKKRFPFIKVNEYFDNGPPLFERFMTEQRSGITDADVVQTTNNTLMNEVIKEGYAAKYPLTSAALYPKTALTPKAYSFGLSTRAVYLYNTNLVDEEKAKSLETWDGLWSGAFDDLPVAVADPGNTSASLSYLYMIRDLYGEAAWEKLAATKPTIAAGTAVGDAVSRGSAAVTFVSEGVAADILATGAPVRWTVPNPVIAEPGPQAVVAAAPHPNAARLFQEFTFSEEGQRIYSETGLFISERKGLVTNPPQAKEPWFKSFADRQIYDLDEAKFNAQTEDILAKFQDIFL